jgi:hypothetical protein
MANVSCCDGWLKLFKTVLEVTDFFYLLDEGFGYILIETCCADKLNRLFLCVRFFFEFALKFFFMVFVLGFFIMV